MPHAPPENPHAEDKDKALHPISIRRLPAWSLRNERPGGTTVVALYSVIIAGPCNLLPALIEARGMIRVLCLLPEKWTMAAAGLRFPCSSLILRRESFSGEATRPRIRTVTISTSRSGLL